VSDLQQFQVQNPDRAVKVLAHERKWDEDGTTASVLVVTGKIGTS
jgi:hypothetical protein